MKTEEIDSRIGMPDVEQEWMKFEREVIDAEQRPTIGRNGKSWVMQRAAMIAVVCSLAFVALASWLYVGVFSAERVATIPTQSAESVTLAEEVKLPVVEECLTFDNVEMQEIAATLATCYGVEPVFLDESIRHMRLYVSLERTMTLDEVVDYLNNLQGLTLSMEGDRLLIE